MGVRACLALALLAHAAEAAPSVSATSEPAAAKRTAKAPAKKGRALARPVLAPGTHTFVAFAGEPAPVHVAWAAVPGAVRYRVRWDEAATDTTQTALAFDKPELQAGQHRVAVIAIGADGGESPPAETAVTVVTVDAIAPGATASLPSPHRAFPIGTRFRSPGLMCELGFAHGSEIAAIAQGAYKLRCGGGSHEPTIELPVVITPIHVSADTAPIARGTRAEIHVTVASTAPIGEHLTVDGLGPIDVGIPERVEGGLDVRVTARDSGVGELVIKSGPFELGRVSLDIVDPAAAQVAIDEVQWAAFDLGVTIGGLFTPGEGSEANLLGHPMDPDDTVKTGPTFGARLGFFPTRRLGLEAEVAMATMGYESRQGIAPLLVARGQLAARLVEDGRFGLRAVLGAGALDLLADAGTSRAGAVGALHYGGAFTIETRRDVAVRLQVLHVITAAQDAGYAHCFELSAGISVRLGRRDRFR